MEELFIDRMDAAQQLVPLLARYSNSPDAVVLGLPRGGMILAEYVAKKLNLPLDFVIVKKVGAPKNEELAIGAVTEDNLSHFDWNLIRDINASKEYVDEMTERKRGEIEARVSKYRKVIPQKNLHGKIAIIVDDGIATGSTMCAAVCSVIARGAKKVVIAVPVASKESIRITKKSANEVCCPFEREHFGAVGQFYKQFPEVSDDDVLALIKTYQS